MSTAGTCEPMSQEYVKGSCTAYRFSMQPSQYSLLHRSLVDATITEQRILGLRDLHLQW